MTDSIPTIGTGIQWIIQFREGEQGVWRNSDIPYRQKSAALIRLATRRRRFSRWEHRLVKATTTYEVVTEAEDD